VATQTSSENGIYLSSERYPAVGISGLFLIQEKLVDDTSAKGPDVALGEGAR